MNPVFLFALCSLAVWRITHLLSKEDGPFDLIYLLRKKAGAGFFGSLLDCFYCVSIWTALPFGLLIGNNWIERILYWWAISGLACLLEKLTGSAKNDKGHLPDFKED